MSRFGDFLRRATTTTTLRAMVEANRAIDAESSDPLAGDCVCGIPMRAHRLPSGAQVTCREAERLLAIDVFRQPNERLQAGAKVISMLSYRREFVDRLAEGFSEIDSADVLGSSEKV